MSDHLPLDFAIVEMKAAYVRVDGAQGASRCRSSAPASRILVFVVRSAPGGVSCASSVATKIQRAKKADRVFML